MRMMSSHVCNSRSWSSANDAVCVVPDLTTSHQTLMKNFH
ncbi:hypothetical protein GBAR_LOCUS24154 [Geodia barretti]|uniref:Uncharacterized protein n=1 Tax=Geodia barretti TaxID=519541 RepID=A0AA35T9N2_GEOBA|nr:hypothetical protein GBAR_LOCUS24154 [Geodia barretti]